VFSECFLLDSDSGQNFLQRDEAKKAGNDKGLQVGVHLQFTTGGIQVLFESALNDMFHCPSPKPNPLVHQVVRLIPTEGKGASGSVALQVVWAGYANGLPKSLLENAFEPRIGKNVLRSV